MRREQISSKFLAENKANSMMAIINGKSPAAWDVAAARAAATACGKRKADDEPLARKSPKSAVKAAVMDRD